MKLLGVLFFGFLILAGVVWVVRDRQPAQILGVQTMQPRPSIDVVGIRKTDKHWLAEGISLASTEVRLPIFAERSIAQIFSDDQERLWTVEQSGSAQLLQRNDETFAPAELLSVSSREMRIVDIDPQSQNMLTLEKSGEGEKMYFFDSGSRQTVQVNASSQNGLIGNASRLLLWSVSDPSISPVWVEVGEAGAGAEVSVEDIGEILFASRDHKNSGEIIIADRFTEQGRSWLRWLTINRQGSMTEHSRLADPFGTLSISDAVQISENEWWFLRGDSTYRELWAVNFDLGQQRRLLNAVRAITNLRKEVGVAMIRLLGEKGDEYWLQTLRISDSEPQTLVRAENYDMIVALSL